MILTEHNTCISSDLRRNYISVQSRDGKIYNKMFGFDIILVYSGLGFHGFHCILKSFCNMLNQLNMSEWECTSKQNKTDVAETFIEWDKNEFGT